MAFLRLSQKNTEKWKWHFTPHVSLYCIDSLTVITWSIVWSIKNDTSHHIYLIINVIHANVRCEVFFIVDLDFYCSAVNLYVVYKARSSQPNRFWCNLVEWSRISVGAENIPPCIPQPWVYLGGKYSATTKPFVTSRMKSVFHPEEKWLSSGWKKITL